MDHEPPSWTADKVCARLVAAFGVLPHAPILSDGGLRRFHPELPGGAALDGLEAFGWVLEFLEHDDRLILLTWARCTATGASARAMCRERGWQRSSFDRRRRAAAEKVADALNGSSAGKGNSVDGPA